MEVFHWMLKCLIMELGNVPKLWENIPKQEYFRLQLYCWNLLSETQLLWTHPHERYRVTLRTPRNIKIEADCSWTSKPMLFTAWKVSKYGDFSGPYFTVFGLNKIRTRKSSVFGHFSHSEQHCYLKKHCTSNIQKPLLYIFKKSIFKASKKINEKFA